MSETSKWVLSKGSWIDPTAVLPGIWKCRDGGFLIRGRAKNPMTGALKDVRQVVRTESPAEALQILEKTLASIRKGETEGASERAAPRIPTLKRFTVQLLEEKIARGRIRSASTREVWKTIFEKIFKAPFASYQVDKVEPRHINDWLHEEVDPLVRNGTYSAAYVNSWLSRLRTVTRAFTGLYRLPSDPMACIADYDHREDGYDDTAPNSLVVEELGEFLKCLEKFWPQFYAFAYLGFMTGLRPSHMRPIRRCGEHADVLWDEGVILIRQSHSRNQEVMATTKNGKRQRLALPAMMMDVLRRHTQTYPWSAQQESELLFPSRTGKLQARSVLDVPFKDVAERLRMTKKITAKGMRRTAIDLSRLAALDTKTRMEISGHKTERMLHLYETIPDNQMREALQRVSSFFPSGSAAPALRVIEGGA